FGAEVYASTEVPARPVEHDGPGPLVADRVIHRIDDARKRGRVDEVRGWAVHLDHRDVAFEARGDAISHAETSLAASLATLPIASRPMWAADTRWSRASARQVCMRRA